MQTDWQWPMWPKKCFIIKKINKLKKKEGNNYERFRIWWTICTTRIKRKTK